MTTTRCRKLIGVAVGLGTLAMSAVPVAGKQTGCTSIEITGKVLWISSAAWVKELDSIALVDPLQNKVLLLSSSGALRSVDDKQLGQSEAEMVPAIIDAVSTGYLLKMVDQRVLWLDRKLGSPRTKDISQGSPNYIRSVYDWSIAGRYALGYGAVKINDKTKFGFFRAPLDNFTDFDLLAEFAQPDFYLLGNKYFTDVGKDGYFVLMDKEPSIYKVPFDGGGKVVELKSFPDGFRPIRSLQTESSGPSSDEELFRELEGMKIPAGLYGHGNFLYLLTRESHGKRTLWQLHQIDPGKDEILGTPIKLPTSANHITIIATEENWFIIEKGPVSAPLGQQNIERMLSIPSSAIRARSVPESCQSPSR